MMVRCVHYTEMVWGGFGRQGVNGPVRFEACLGEGEFEAKVEGTCPKVVCPANTTPVIKYLLHIIGNICLRHWDCETHCAEIWKVV